MVRIHDFDSTDDELNYEDHVLSTLLSSDELRVLELEETFPNVKFLREDGKIRGWFGIPEQAYGTIDGNPFHYRFRDNNGSLVVWSSEEISLEQSMDHEVDTNAIDPILMSEVIDWIPNDDYSSTTVGVDCIKHLIENLKTPEPHRLTGNRRGAIAEKFGLWRTGDFQKSLERWDYCFRVIDRKNSFMNSDEIFLQCNDGVVVKVNWSFHIRDGSGVHSNVVVSVNAPLTSPVLTNPVFAKSVAQASFPLGNQPNVDDVVDMLFEEIDNAQWEYMSSFTNHTNNGSWLDDLLNGVEERYNGADLHEFIAKNELFVHSAAENFNNTVKK